TTWLGLPAALLLGAGASLVAFLGALPARFASDVCRPEPPIEAIAGFFRDARRILTDRAARGSLLGLAAFMALILRGSGAGVARRLGATGSSGRMDLFQNVILVGVGVAAGSLLASLQGHPRRSLGLVPVGATGLLGALAWAALSADPRGACLLLGLMG